MTESAKPIVRYPHCVTELGRRGIGEAISPGDAPPPARKITAALRWTWRGRVVKRLFKFVGLFGWRPTNAQTRWLVDWGTRVDLDVPGAAGLVAAARAGETIELEASKMSESKKWDFANMTDAQMCAFIPAEQTPERDDAESAVLELVGRQGGEMPCEKLFGFLTKQGYSSSRLRHALLTLADARRIEITPDRRVIVSSLPELRIENDE